MNTRNLPAAIALIIGIPIAIFLGISAAQEQIETMLWIAGTGFLILCISLGRHIWILIPATIGMRGMINVLPGTPQPWHLMTVVVLGFTILRLAARKQSFRFRWTGMETAVLLVAFTILQAFARNPTGLSVFGGAYAGGKPYFVFGVAMVAFVLIGAADADLRSWKWAVIAYIVVSVGDGLVASASAVSPEFAMLLVRIYSNVNVDAVMSLGYEADLGRVRLSQFGQLGTVLGLVATCFWRPVLALDIRKPWRGIVALGAVVGTMLSGGRGTIARLGIYFIYGSLLRRKPLDVVVVLALGGFLLTSVVVAGYTTELPYGVQRALSFLPIKVRRDVEIAAQGSSEIRFNMWKAVLSTDRYIENKWVGDGFRISASEQAARRAWTLGDRRMRQAMSKEELHLAGGSYHGFHVETIRFTGAIGLIAATAALIVFAVFAARGIRQYRGTRHWGYVLFVCMPFLIHPWWYWLVFGAYRNQFPQLIVMAGMLKAFELIRRADIPSDVRLNDKHEQLDNSIESGADPVSA